MQRIRYIQRADLDVAKWNACIDAADNALIYAYSFYLDALCDHWDALVLDDYCAVMPLPWRKKWGIHYVYQPSFLPFTGVFGKQKHLLNPEVFLQHIPRKFKYWVVDCNEQIRLSQDFLRDNKSIQIETRSNYFLNLEQPYQQIYKNYKRLAKRKITMANDAQLIVDRNVQPDIIINYYRQYYKEEQASITDAAYNRLLSFCVGSGKQNISTYRCRFAGGEVAAFYLLLVDERYVYSLMGGSSPAGKEAGAFYLLTDAVLKDYSNSKRIFRFEGSDVPGIAFFDQQFGPYPVSYLQVRENRLPRLLQLFKR